MTDILDRIELDDSQARDVLAGLGRAAAQHLGETGVQSAEAFEESIGGIADVAKELSREIERLNRQATLDIAKASSDEYRDALLRSRDAATQLRSANGELATGTAETSAGINAASVATQGMGGMFLVAANQGKELFASLVNVGKGAWEAARAGEAAQRAAAGFSGDMESLTANSLGLVNDTMLQQLDQMADGISENTGIVIELDDALKLATDRFAKGLGGSVGENAMKLLKGEAEAYRELAIGVDMNDSRLQGLDETRKKAMMTQIALAEASSINLGEIDQSTLAISQSTVAWENLISDLQIGAAEFLQTSGILDVLSSAVGGLTRWFGENKAMINDIATRALRFLTRGFEGLGPIIEIVADTVLVLADGLTTFMDVATDIGNFLNPLSGDFLGLGEETDAYASIVRATVTDNEDFAESLKGVSEEAEVTTAKITGLKNATIDLGDVDTAGVTNDTAQAWRDLGKDAELLKTHLEGLGQLQLAQASVAEEYYDAINRRDSLQGLITELDNLNTATAEGRSRTEEILGTFRRMGLSAGDARIELAGLNVEVGGLFNLLEAVAGEPEKPVRSTKKAVTELDNAFLSLIATGREASEALLLLPIRAELDGAGIGGLDDAGSALTSAFSANDDGLKLEVLQGGLDSAKEMFAETADEIAANWDDKVNSLRAESAERFAVSSAQAMGDAYLGTFDAILAGGDSFRENMMGVLGELWGQLSAGFLAWATAEGNLLAGNPFGAIAAAVALGAIGSVIGAIGSRGSGGSKSSTSGTNAQRYNERARERETENRETKVTVNLVGIPVPDETARQIADAVDSNMRLRGAA